MSATLSRVRSLRRRVVAADPEGGSLPDLEHLQNLTRAISDMVDGLVRLAECGRILEIEAESALQQRLAATLHALRETFRKDPEAVGQGTEFSQFKQSLANYNTSLRKATEDTWADSKHEVLQEVPEGMLSFWETIPPLRNDAAHLRRLVAELDHKRSVAADPEKLRLLLAKCDEIREVVSRLYSFDAPPAVQTFMKASRRGGARWAQLTEEVQGWLEEHSLLDSLRIRLD